MNIGLITIFQVPNFGSVLQAYATQNILEKLGHNCTVINYKYPNKTHTRNKHSIKEFLYKLTTPLGLNSQQRKSNKINRFRKESINLSERYNTFDDLRNHDWSNYDVFIVGSDQMWNTKYTNCEPAFLLDFLPPKTKKISIATSFAVDSIPTHYTDIFKKNLSEFYALSVREKSGKNIINNQLGLSHDVFVCLDPTLLLSKDEWLKGRINSKPNNGRPYILYYMWAYAFEPRPYINEVAAYFKEKLGDIDIIALEGAPKSDINGVKYINRENSSVDAFLGYFAHAELVITSSFHGTAFAANFGIPLISIIPDHNGDNRQSDLLNNLGIPAKAVKVNTDIDSITPYYDIDKEQQTLEKIRQSCIKWISNNL